MTSVLYHFRTAFLGTPTLLSGTDGRTYCRIPETESETSRIPSVPQYRHQHHDAGTNSTTTRPSRHAIPRIKCKPNRHGAILFLQEHGIPRRGGLSLSSRRQNSPARHFRVRKCAAMEQNGSKTAQEAHACHAEPIHRTRLKPKSAIRLAGAFPMAEMVLSGILSASARSLMTDSG